MVLEGKNILISGASSGIGAACAEILALEGANIFINFLDNEKSAKDVMETIHRSGGSAKIFKADIAKKEAVLKMFSDISAEATCVDILINNATPKLERLGVLDLSWKNFEKQINVHIQGAFNLTKAVLPKMIGNKSGNIINILSSVIFDEMPMKKMCDYATAKSGLYGFSRCLASELAPYNIRINTVSPEFTDTRLNSDLPERVREIIGSQTSLKRVLKPIDVAKTVRYALVHDGEFKNGENLFVIDKYLS